ncbi:serine protease inhibitor [Kribbella amoyensis]|uniref:Serine protease inhibitor n=1 Tax=Kribbella amoyensis TaxID=996641 RepID=A0A561BTP0_9ACTN|nr:serpin family protein [Kribbella amoyensis]TWD82270.1 serine protease inhibitor [Kribbella amoyensis]
MDAHQVGRLTSRWIDTLPGDDSTVVSGYGVAPLIAMLGALANEPARSELLAVADSTELLPSTEELRTAVALWTNAEVPLEPGLDKVIPPELRGVLSDRDALDQWVNEQTGGLLQRMPVELTPETLLVLASALAVRTSWALPFTENERFVDGRPVWWLSRADPDLGTVRLHRTAAGPLTAITVRGTGEVDVRLVVGEPGASRSAVLGAGLALADSGAGAEELLGGTAAPGVKVIESMAPRPAVLLGVPYFEVDAEHDLLATPEVFGLAAASDPSRGHFPGVSPMPLAVSQAKQAVMARFSAKGFEAAAVTAMPMAAGSAPMPGAKALWIDLDRPFGFIAVHRPTGLPLVAGWTTSSAYKVAGR